MTKKYDLSSICRTAARLHKEGMTLSQAMKAAWREAKTVAPAPSTTPLSYYSVAKYENEFFQEGEDEKGNPVGYYENPDCQGAYVQIDKIFVEEGARGHGVGRRLLQQAITEARSYGCPIYLVALPLDEKTDMERLVAFYESEGFSGICEAGQGWLMGL